MRLVAIGSRVFVTSLRLAGTGIVADSPGQALSQINSIGTSDDVGLLLLSDDIGKKSVTKSTIRPSVLYR